MTNRNQLGVLAVQRAVANASPSFWRDLIVIGRSGEALLAADLEGTRYRLLTPAPAEVGEPVAMHPIAEILSVGAEQFPARVLSEF